MSDDISIAGMAAAAAVDKPGRLVAVCVCTCRRPAHLVRLLDRLATASLADLGADRAVVLVVDNAPDGTVERACAACREKLAVPLHLAREPERGISFARNRAVMVALGLGADLVAFLDDDDLPEPDWLRRLLERQRASDADLVFGLASPRADAAVPYLLSGLDEFRPRSLERLNRYGLPAAAGTCNLLLHRRLLETLAAQGPVFLPELAFTGGSDSELLVRAHRAHFHGVTAPRSVVVTGMEPHG